MATTFVHRPAPPPARTRPQAASAVPVIEATVNTTEHPSYPSLFYPSEAYPSTTTETFIGAANYPASDNYPGDKNFPGAQDLAPAPPPLPATAPAPPTVGITGAWGRGWWTRSSWLGDATHVSEQVGGVKPTESEVRYFWNARTVASAWTVGAWGGRQATVPISGGMTVNTDRLAGTVALDLWWADALYLNLTRVAKDGTHTPVRGYHPFTVTGATRHNYSVNPTCSVSIDGYVSVTGALSRITGVNAPEGIATALRIEQQSSLTGDLGVIFPERIFGRTTTRGFWMRSSVIPTTAQVWTQWADDLGNLIGVTTAYISDAARSQSYKQWSWCCATTPAPSGAAYGTAMLILTGIASGATVDVTGQLLENGDHLTGDFFDGTMTQGGWKGKAGLSASTLAPIQYVIDGEAPLDEPVTYLLTSPNSPGFSITSQSVTLAAVDERTSWVTHPGAPNYPTKLWVESAPNLTRALDQGSFAVIGRQHPIVKSATVRRGPTGQITMVTESMSSRDRMLAMLSDGQPLLVRAPASYGYPDNWWLAMADVEEQLIVNYAAHPVRKWVGNFTEVDAPVDYVSNSPYGQALTRAAASLTGQPTSDRTLFGPGATLVPPPAYAVRWALGLVTEGQNDSSLLYESTVPYIDALGDVAGFRGNVLGIDLPSGGASNPGPGATPEAGIQRCELLPKLAGLAGNTDGVFGPGETGVFGLAFELKAGFPTSTTAHQAISEWHNATGSTSPPLELCVGSGQLFLRGNAGGWSIPICSVTTGERYNVVLSVLFGETAGTSQVDVWVNGTPYVTAATPTGAGFLYSGVLNTWRFGLFRDSTITAASTIDFGALAYDTSVDSVAAFIAAV